MVLTMDRSLPLGPQDTAESPRPRSLDLALARMGFRIPAASSRQACGDPRWHRDRNDPAPDWQPL